jgi:alkylated DNA nucleotide flippase Atl1
MRQKAKKTWQEKLLDKKDLPKVVKITSKMAGKWELKQGDKNITPWWRTLKGDGELNEKYPGGVENQKMLLEAEGHIVEKEGKKWLVKNAQAFIKDWV